MENIWFKDYSIEYWESFTKNTILETLDIKLISIDENSISGSMPVSNKTIQPFGILHGGASVVLAESLGSIASTMVIDNSKFYSVGLQVNANHIKAVKAPGIVYGEAKAIHIGRKTHIWEIEIRNANKKLTCVSRLTVAILPKPS